MKKNLFPVVTLLFMVLSSACSTDPMESIEPHDTPSTRTITPWDIVNDIQLTGDYVYYYYTGLEVSVTYLPNPSNYSIAVLNGEQGDWVITSGLEEPFKVVFLKAGTYTICVSSGGRNFQVLATREITVYADHIVRFYQYRKATYPFDYWITPNLYGLNYTHNGYRELAGGNTGRSGPYVTNHPTSFYAFPELPSIYGNQFWWFSTKLIPVSIDPTQLSNSLYYIYRVETPVDFQGYTQPAVFWIFKDQVPGSVPLYSIEVYVRELGKYTMLSTEMIETSDPQYEMISGYLVIKYAGTILGYVFPSLTPSTLGAVQYL